MRGVMRGVKRGVMRGVTRGVMRGVMQGVKRGVMLGMKRGVKQGPSPNAPLPMCLSTDMPVSTILLPRYREPRWGPEIETYLGDRGK